MDPADYRLERFAPLVGSAFTVRLSDGRSLPFQLIEVRPGPSSARMHQFALTFLGPMRPQLVQQIVRLTNDQLGDLDVFIVPVAADDRGVQYEAVFSRLNK